MTGSAVFLLIIPEIKRPNLLTAVRHLSQLQCAGSHGQYQPVLYSCFDASIRRASEVINEDCI